MKLKFRADKDDLIIFGVFALFLLYIIAIGIVNLHTLTTEGVFSGFNPFLAFTPKFLWMTLLIYIVSLIGMFASVKSYFFEMEKGLVLQLKRKIRVILDGLRIKKFNKNLQWFLYKQKQLMLVEFP